VLGGNVVAVERGTMRKIRIDAFDNIVVEQR
jgi:hypothetical protein